MKKGAARVTAVEKASNSAVVWRVLSILIILGVVGVVLGYGKPILTAFVVSDTDYNAQIDPAVANSVASGGEARVIVKLKDESGLKALVLDDASDIEEQIDTNYISGDEKILSADIDSQELASLESNPAVLEVKPVKEISLFLQDASGIINATMTWNYQVNLTTNATNTTNATSTLINITGEGQTICVIDTGINFSHSDLSGKNALGGSANIDCINSDCIANSSVSDDHGHGTFVAGIAAASGGIKGTAPNTKLIGIKVLNSQGAGYEDDLKLGMEWCINNSATYNISTISLSLGTTTLYTSACDYVDDDLNMTDTVNGAVASGISVVAATGNSGSTTGIASPACITNSTSVGAVDKNDLILYNRNSQTDLLAVGSSINSTTISGSYTSQSGTSMSTPQVAGAFALLQQFYYWNNNSQAGVSLIESTLKNTGKSITDGSATYPRINIYSALQALLGITSNNTSNNTGNQTGNETNQINQTNQTGNYITVSLTSPSSGLFINASSANQAFTCNLSTNYSSYNNNTNATSYASIARGNFYLWNSTGSLVYNDSYDASSGSNSSSLVVNFTYNLSQLASAQYSWNCMAVDSQNYSGLASANRTINYDTQVPIVILNAPVNDSTASANVVFNFTVSDNNAVSLCNLTRNGQYMGLRTGIANGNSASNTFSYTLTDSGNNGKHAWSVACFDVAGNYNSSETRTFTFNYVPPASNNQSQSNTTGGAGGSGGGGSGGEEGEAETRYQPASYTMSAAETYAGKEYVVGAEDQIKFMINKDGQDIENTMNIDAIGLHTMRFIFTEKKKTETIIEGEEKSYSLEYSDKNDFSVKLSSISAGKATVTIKSLIEPPKPVEQQTAPTTGNVVQDQELNKTTGDTSKLSGFAVGIREKANYFIAVGIIAIVVLAYFIFRRIRTIRAMTSAKPGAATTKADEDKKFLDKTIDTSEKDKKK